MLINSYLAFCFLLFSMTTLLQLGVYTFSIHTYRAHNSQKLHLDALTKTFNPCFIVVQFTKRIVVIMVEMPWISVVRKLLIFPLYKIPCRPFSSVYWNSYAEGREQEDVQPEQSMRKWVVRLCPSDG